MAVKLVEQRTHAVALFRIQATSHVDFTRDLGFMAKTD